MHASDSGVVRLTACKVRWMNIQAGITTLIWMIHQSFCLGHPLFTARVFQCLMFPGYKHVKHYSRPWRLLNGIGSMVYIWYSTNWQRARYMRYKNCTLHKPQDFLPVLSSMDDPSRNFEQHVTLNQTGAHSVLGTLAVSATSLLAFTAPAKLQILFRALR